MAGHSLMKEDWGSGIKLLMVQKHCSLCIQSSLFMCSFLRNNIPSYVVESVNCLYYYLSIKLIKCMGLTWIFACADAPSWSYSMSSGSKTMSTAIREWVQPALLGGSYALMHTRTHRPHNLSHVKRLTLKGNWFFSRITRSSTWTRSAKSRWGFASVVHEKDWIMNKELKVLFMFLTRCLFIPCWIVQNQNIAIKTWAWKHLNLKNRFHEVVLSIYPHTGISLKLWLGFNVKGNRNRVKILEIPLSFC